MPTDPEHLAAYKGHLASYGDTVEKHPDWGAVMLFYCAVHYVERLLCLDSIHCTDHGERDYELKTRYSSIWGHYRVLKGESLKARYMDGGVFAMTAGQVSKKLLHGRLAAIIADVDGRIAARSILTERPPA